MVKSIINIVLLFYVSKLWMAYQEVLNNRNGYIAKYAIKFEQAKKEGNSLTFITEDKEDIIQKTNVGLSAKVRLSKVIEDYLEKKEFNKDLECGLYVKNDKGSYLESYNIEDIKYDETQKSVKLTFNKTLNFDEAENYSGLIMFKINSKVIAKKVDFLSNDLKLLTPIINFIGKQINNFTKPKEESSESGSDDLTPPDGGSA